MKKVLFLQVKGNICGGVWFVNKSIGEELIKKGYQVEVFSVRDSQTGIKLDYDSRLKVSILNSKDLWEITRLTDVTDVLKRGKIFKGCSLFVKKIIDNCKLKRDFKRVKKYIRENKFDYIITTHYQLLDAIPREYLSKTIHEQHISFEMTYKHMATRKTFDKYKDKIKFLWLTKATCEDAVKAGYLNSTYIYNPVRFKCSKRSDVTKNKKLITVSRISQQKRIDRMVEIVSDIFKDPKYDDWVLEIYGDGDLKDDILKMNYDKKRIKLMGLIAEPMDKLLESSINLNTSLFEGFAMSILEANECGVPTVTFNFGESTEEEIIQGKTGYFVEQDDVEGYKERLKELMDDKNKLEEFSKNCKEFSNNFQVEAIIEKWIDLFNNLD